MLKTAHESIRNNPGRLDEYLVDPESRELLARKLAGYRTILSKHFPWHPGLADGAFDWEERLQTAKGIDVRLVGLSTVWVSDSFDGGAAPDTSLEANMLLGGAQLAATLGKMGKPEFLIILTHHPASWLTLSCRNLFVGEAARYPHVHLCGHVHEAEATLMRRLGDTTTNLTYVAGAAHGQPSDRHGYSWGALARDRRDGVWHVGWAPRIYVRDRNEFRPESTRFDLDDRHINWTELKISS
jgi:hypothetical protein